METVIFPPRSKTELLGSAELTKVKEGLPVAVKVDP
jgi:hypothetical protein